MGRPIGTGSNSASSLWLIDQTVVSVGPYILMILVCGHACLISEAKLELRASPPTNKNCNEENERTASASSTSIRAIDGVHCKCVTLWLLANAPIDCSPA